MANFQFVVLSSHMNANGECVVKLRVQHNAEKKYISTNVKCKPDSFRGGRVTGAGAGIKNKELDVFMARVTKVYNAIDFPDGMSCRTLVEVIKSGNTQSTAKVEDVLPMAATSVMVEQCNVVGQRRTMKSVFDEFILNYKEETRKVYTDAWNKWVAFAGENVVLQDLNAQKINAYIYWMKTTPQGKKKKRILSDTTIKMYSTNLKVIVNYAEKMGYVRFFPHPWVTAKVPASNVRDTAITIEQMRKVRDLDISRAKYGIRTSRDLFLLTFYLGGMNLCDILDTNWREVRTKRDGVLTYNRNKTEKHKKLNYETTFTVQPEAWEIINKYMQPNGKVAFGKKKTRASIDSCLYWNMKFIAESCGIKDQFTLYSARKSFVQYGLDIKFPLHVLEYCAGQTMKSDRPIFSYGKVMKKHADEAIRKIIDHLFADVRN